MLALMFLLIINFGKVDDHVYRSAQIQPSEVVELQGLGITVVINLREKPVKWEKGAVEAAGMTYYSIPMSSTRRPKMETLNRVLKIIDDSKGKVLVHCNGGRHRTGLIIAIYRINKYHWTFEQVYREMKLYDYYSGLTHGAIKDFVRDYSKLAP